MQTRPHLPPTDSVLCPDRQLRPLPAAIDYALEHGCMALIEAATAGFPDAQHRMKFPRRVGFTVQTETQVSDTFARAVIANGLVDALPYLPQPYQAKICALLRAEAEYLWKARETDLCFPFRYFSGLAELPPDADTFAAALLLFAKVAPHYADALTPAVNALCTEIQQRRWVRTWQIQNTDPYQKRRAMERGIQRYWGDTFDLGVNAQVAIALSTIDRLDAARQVAAALATQQQADGTFIPRWYAGEIIGTSLCLSAVQSLLPLIPAVAQARAALLSRQRQDGGWGNKRSEALDTAYALWALGQHTPRLVLEKGIRCLLDHQRQDGGWNEGNWIAMPIQSQPTGTCRVASFGSRSVTTALVVRTLASLRSGGSDQRRR